LQLKSTIDDVKHSRFEKVAFSGASYNAYQRGVGDDLARERKDPKWAEAWDANSEHMASQYMSSSLCRHRLIFFSYIRGLDA
jgi:hypothetical protein